MATASLHHNPAVDAFANSLGIYKDPSPDAESVGYTLTEVKPDQLSPGLSSSPSARRLGDGYAHKGRSRPEVASHSFESGLSREHSKHSVDAAHESVSPRHSSVSPRRQHGRSPSARGKPSGYAEMYAVRHSISMEHGAAGTTSAADSSSTSAAGLRAKEAELVNPEEERAVAEKLAHYEEYLLTLSKERAAQDALLMEQDVTMQQALAPGVSAAATASNPPGPGPSPELTLGPGSQQQLQPSNQEQEDTVLYDASADLSALGPPTTGVDSLIRRDVLGLGEVPAPVATEPSGAAKASASGAPTAAAATAPDRPAGAGAAAAAVAAITAAAAATAAQASAAAATSAPAPAPAPLPARAPPAPAGLSSSSSSYGGSGAEQPAVIAGPSRVEGGRGAAAGGGGGATANERDFLASQMQRSRQIAEQLARLQDESRRLQEHSRLLQQRAVDMQRQLPLFTQQGPADPSAAALPNQPLAQRGALAPTAASAAATAAASRLKPPTKPPQIRLPPGAAGTPGAGPTEPSIPPIPSPYRLRQGSAASSTVDPSLPKWADQVSSAAPTPLMSPLHYQLRFPGSPEKARPVPGAGPGTGTFSFSPAPSSAGPSISGVAASAARTSPAKPRTSKLAPVAEDTGGEAALAEVAAAAAAPSGKQAGVAPRAIARAVSNPRAGAAGSSNAGPAQPHARRFLPPMPNINTNIQPIPPGKGLMSPGAMGGWGAPMMQAAPGGGFAPMAGPAGMVAVPMVPMGMMPMATPPAAGPGPGPLLAAAMGPAGGKPGGSKRGGQAAPQQQAQDMMLGGNGAVPFMGPGMPYGASWMMMPPGAAPAGPMPYMGAMPVPYMGGMDPYGMDPSAPADMGMMQPSGPAGRQARAGAAGARSAATANRSNAAASGAAKAVNSAPAQVMGGQAGGYGPDTALSEAGTMGIMGVGYNSPYSNNNGGPGGQTPWIQQQQQVQPGMGMGMYPGGPDGGGDLRQHADMVAALQLSHYQGVQDHVMERLNRQQQRARRRSRGPQLEEDGRPPFRVF